MRKHPLVTIITPSYNQGRFLKDNIESVLSQDYPFIEHLIIDAGSNDSTLEVLRSYGDRVSWISEPDNGQTDAINKGFRLAKGEIICWLNSDDTYEPGAIKTAVKYLVENPDVMMIYGDGNEIAEDGSFLHRFPATQHFDLWALTYIHDYILQPTTFFRKRVFENIQLPDESLNWCMDWDLWIRIGRNYKVAYVDFVAANSRIYAETKTGSGGIRRFNEITSVMRKYGKRKYPLGFFLYGTDTLDTISRTKHPLSYKLISIFFHFVRRKLASLQYDYQGVYSDGWLGKTAHLLIPVTKDATSVLLALEVPPNVTPLTVTAVFNGERPMSFIVKSPSIFELAKTTSSLEPVEVTLSFDKSFRPKGEKRHLCCKLSKLHLS